jgi:quercetin dioxygenase-like cupin family protein
MTVIRFILAPAAALAMLAAGLGLADEPITRRELMRADITGVEGRDGIVYVADFAPGAIGGRHTHWGDEFAYVLEGTIVLEREGMEPMTLGPGDVVHLSQGLAHAAKTGSGEPAKVLVFQVTEKGKPLAEPAQ